MKALIIQNTVSRVFEAVPEFLDEFQHIQRPDLLTAEELELFGIKIIDFDFPPYNPELQELGNGRFENGAVVYEVLPRTGLPNLEELAAQRSQEFDRAVEQITFEMTKVILPKIVRIFLAQFPAEFQQLFAMLEAEKERVRGDIASFVANGDIAGLRAYKIRHSDVENFIEGLRMFKE